LSRRHQGTGLGLPIVTAVMALHGGRLTLDSVVDRGTMATVAFPPDRLVTARSADGQSRDVA